MMHIIDQCQYSLKDNINFYRWVMNNIFLYAKQAHITSQNGQFQTLALGSCYRLNRQLTFLKGNYGTMVG